MEVSYMKDRGTFIVFTDGHGLEMVREEAEELFVQLGHALQDADVDQFDESMSEPQPRIIQ